MPACARGRGAARGRRPLAPLPRGPDFTLSDTSPATSIRPAVPADLPAIGRLGALLVRMHHDLDPKRFIAPTPQTARGYGSFLRTQLAEPNVIVLIAERDGEALGYSYASVEE